MPGNDVMLDIVYLDSSAASKHDAIVRECQWNRLGCVGAFDGDHQFPSVADRFQSFVPRHVPEEARSVFDAGAERSTLAVGCDQDGDVAEPVTRNIAGAFSSCR